MSIFETLKLRICANNSQLRLFSFERQRSIAKKIFRTIRSRESRPTLIDRFEQDVSHRADFVDLLKINEAARFRNKIRRCVDISKRETRDEFIFIPVFFFHAFGRRQPEKQRT